MDLSTESSLNSSSLSSQNSEPPNPSSLASSPETLATLSSHESFNDLPIDSVLETLVHDLSNSELMEYVKRCALLRSSAQSRKAALSKEGGTKPKKAAKSSVEKAMELLSQLQKKVGG